MSLCAECGKQVEEGTTFCSNCGHTFNPVFITNSVSAETKNMAGQSMKAARGLRWKAICLGAIVMVLLQAALVSLVLYLAVISSSNLSGEEGLFIGLILSIAGFTVLLVVIPITNLIGGAVSGALARDKGWIHGMISGLFAYAIFIIVLVIILCLADRSKSNLSVGMTIGISIGELILVIGFGALGGVLGERRRRRRLLSTTQEETPNS